MLFSCLDEEHLTSYEHSTYISDDAEIWPLRTCIMVSQDLHLGLPRCMSHAER